VGLLAGHNDHELMEQTGELRDINRHRYTLEEIDTAMQQPVVRRLLKLMDFRSNYPAFNGVFHLMYSNATSVAMCWRKDEYRCELFVDLIFKKATVGYIDQKSKRWLTFRC
jgi:glucosylglycerol phosphorylase (configuration-retaining)